MTVDLYGSHFFGGLGKQSRQAAQSGPDFQHFILRGDLCVVNDLAQGLLVHQKILSQPLMRVKVMVSQ